MKVYRGIAPPVLTLLIIALSLFAFLSERASSQQMTLYDPSIGWSAPQQSANVLLYRSNLVLSVYWKSEAPLDTAWLATNESGVWENKTSIYSLKFRDSAMGWSNFTWFNASVSDTQVCWRIYANNSLGVLNTTPALCFVIKKARLYAWITLQSLNAITHSNSLMIPQNSTLNLSVTITCMPHASRGSCGNVNATARYNSTSAYPDTLISTTQNDRPFYIIDGTNPKSCPNNPLSAGDSCYISWQVNATGDIGSSYEVGVLFESDLPGVDSNHTENKTVTIVSCVVSLILGWTSIDFGTLLPGTTGNPAPDNNNYLYNITVDPSTTCNVDIYIKGSDLNKTGSKYYIGVGNVSWNTENSYSTSKRTGSTDSLVSSAVSPGTNITTFYWIDVPPGIAADTYSGYLWITGVESV